MSGARDGLADGSRDQPPVRLGPARIRQLTADGRGAIAVIEIAGVGAARALERLVERPLPKAGSLALVRLVVAGERLDDAILVARGPELFELHVSGSPALLERVRTTLGIEEERTVLAQSLEEQAEELLARAPSLAAARTLVDQAEGALRAALEGLPLADERALRNALAPLLARERIARRLLRPPRVVLAGAVNAGKSTLFNTLVCHERVVVHAEAGTTRDAIEERALLGSYAVDLVDTAGERRLSARDATAEVERAGQALAAELARGADLTLRLVAADEPGLSAPDLAPRSAHERVVISCVDRRPSPALPMDLPRLSALELPERARAIVTAVFREALELPVDPWTRGAAVPFTAAQRRALEQLERVSTPAERAQLVGRLLAR